MNFIFILFSLFAHHESRGLVALIYMPGVFIIVSMIKSIETQVTWWAWRIAPFGNFLIISNRAVLAMDSLIWGKPEPGRKLCVCQTGWKRTCRLNCWMRETIVLAAWAVGERDVMKSWSTTSVYHIWFERWTKDSPPLYLCSSAINFARLLAYSLNFADFFIVVEFDHGYYHKLQTWRWTRIEHLKSKTFIILHDDSSTQRVVVLWLIVHTV